MTKRKYSGGIKDITFNLSDDFKCDECDEIIKRGYIYSVLIMEDDKQEYDYSISSLPYSSFIPPRSKNNSGIFKLRNCWVCSLKKIKEANENVAIIKKEIEAWVERNKDKLAMDKL